PDLFCDLEGFDISRYGTLSTFQVKIASLDHTWILDVTVLGNAAFNTAREEPNGRSFRQVLEDPEIIKVFYDGRNDWDAAYALHGIHMKVVLDLSIMEILIRRGDRWYRKSLERCLGGLSIMTWKDEALWNYHKQKGKSLCEGPLGYQIFDVRPLSPVWLRYACNDVEYMPAAFAEISEILCEQDGW
ncbi:hypothetical protein DL98DRAFT_350732, partial [Cadophora sp. DSE1049]